MKNQNKGITLIALVITIIVLLILAAISIATLTGDNGILTKANDSKVETRGASVEEQRNLWKAEQEADKHSTTKTAKTLNELLDYLEEEKLIIGNERATIEETGKITIGSRTIDFSNDSSVVGTEADKETNYIGYYADLNGDKEPDGIIYADLAKDRSGKWNNEDENSIYSYKAKDGLKSYIVEDEVTSSKFGNKSAKMITEKEGTVGEDRFFVMALEDFDDQYCNYCNGEYEKLNDIVEGSKNDFGEGRTKTATMIKNHEDKIFGDELSTDLWELETLKQEIEKGWFIPSKSEGAAIGDMLRNYLNIEGDFENFGLGTAAFWTSSQYSTDRAWIFIIPICGFDNGIVGGDDLHYRSTFKYNFLKKLKYGW